MGETVMFLLRAACEGVLLWYGFGLLVIPAYKNGFLYRKYPPAKWNGGFFFYLIGHAGEPVTFIEQLAAGHINMSFDIKHSRGLCKLGFWLLREICWTSELSVHILYHRFCLEKAQIIKNASR